MIKLSTKTFGKAAKKEVLGILKQPYRITKVDDCFVLRSACGKMLGHVNTGDFRNPNATLVLSAPVVERHGDYSLVTSNVGTVAVCTL